MDIKSFFKTPTQQGITVHVYDGSGKLLEP